MRVVSKRLNLARNIRRPRRKKMVAMFRHAHLLKRQDWMGRGATDPKMTAIPAIGGGACSRGCATTVGRRSPTHLILSSTLSTSTSSHRAWLAPSATRLSRTSGTSANTWSQLTERHSSGSRQQTVVSPSHLLTRQDYSINYSVICDINISKNFPH